MPQRSTYNPVILPAVRAAATFGATAEEIADYLKVSIACFYAWRLAEPELQEALKRGREQSNQRVVDSLYRRALAGDTTACIFWLKNRLPSEWRDVQNIEANHAHYIVADRPMTEEEWITARADRAKTIEDQSVQQNVATPILQDDDDTANPLE